MVYGTLSVLDTIAASQQTIAQIGEDRAFEGLAQALVAHNALADAALADFVDITEDRQRRYGGAGDTDMVEVDEYGRADVSKVGAGTTVGFPLRRYQRGLQWTRDFMETTTGAQFAAQVDDILAADARNIHRQIRRTIFKPTNSTFVDHLVDHVQLAIKAFVNADGADMPVGPNGETFPSATHTHFLATTTFAAANLDALIDTAIEHYAAGMPIVEINQAQELTVRGLTGFAAYLDARIISAPNMQRADGELNPVNFNNRAIGVYRGAEIWVKSARIPANYVFAWVKGAPKPLVMRRRNAARGALRLVSENESFPLRAQTRERETGFGVWNRTNGAILFIGAATYQEPVL